MEEETRNLHVMMLPWLAMGHLLPFFELSNRLARKGIRISFFSSPANIRRLPSLPPPLAPLIDFVPCPLPSVDNLPPNIDNTADLHTDSTRSLLDQSYAAFEQYLSAFLSDPDRPKPDWIIYDFASVAWAPALAARFGLSSAFFCLFNAAALSLFGRPPAYGFPEELTLVPERVPFPTTVAFRPFEARQLHAMFPKKAKATSSDQCQSGEGPRSQLLLIRTCREFEPRWLDFLGEVYRHRMLVVPTGFLPPSFHKEEIHIAHEWLDGRQPRSVVYVAFGTEARLAVDQIGEIAMGLERSGLPFLWALRTGEPPAGFEERTGGRGLLVKGWVPQAQLLAHSAVGGFLTHGGWNSVVEGLTVGATMAVLPMLFDQGLNARHLAETGFGVEVVRDEEDGSFTGEEIARKLRMVMVWEEGEGLRMRARKGKEVFGSQELQEEYIVQLVKQLWEKRNAEAKAV